MNNKFLVFFLYNFCILNLFSTNAEIDLKLYEKRRIAQHGEDGILEKIFQLVGKR